MFLQRYREAEARDSLGVLGTARLEYVDKPHSGKLPVSKWRVLNDTQGCPLTCICTISTVWNHAQPDTLDKGTGGPRFIKSTDLPKSLPKEDGNNSFSSGEMKLNLYNVFRICSLTIEYKHKVHSGFCNPLSSLVSLPPWSLPPSHTSPSVTLFLCLRPMYLTKIV